MESLHLDSVSYVRNGLAVVDSVSLTLHPRQALGLTGPNGAGKSTLLKLILGDLSPSSGGIHPKKRRGISYLPQESTFSRAIPMTAEQFVSLPFSQNEVSGPGAKELIENLRLKEVFHKRLRDLSGGEWQRLCLVRALLQKAEIYLLDEPFNHLDVAAEEFVGHWVSRLVQETQAAAILVTHDWAALDHFCSEVVLLNRKILMKGPVKEVSERYFSFSKPEHHRWIHGEGQPS